MNIKLWNQSLCLILCGQRFSVHFLSNYLSMWQISMTAVFNVISLDSIRAQLYYSNLKVMQIERFPLLLPRIKSLQPVKHQETFIAKLSQETEPSLPRFTKAIVRFLYLCIFHFILPNTLTPQHFRGRYFMLYSTLIILQVYLVATLKILIYIENFIKHSLCIATWHHRKYSSN